MKIVKKLFSLVIVSFVLLTICGCSETKTNFVKQDVDIYYKTVDDKQTVEVYYKDNNNQIPYVTLDTYREISNKIYNEGIGDYEKDLDYQLSTSYQKDKATLSRENGTNMVFDFTNNTIYFDNYDRFVAHSYDVSPQELPHSSCYDENGNSIYIKRIEEKYTYTNSDPITIDLNKYNIDIFYENNTYYVPLQTLADLLVNMQYCNILYNTQAIFVIDYVTTSYEMGDEPSGLLAKYYDDKTSIRSQELIDYTYNELCLLLDNSYGLKQEHMINDFDTYLTNTINNGKSLKEYLTSENPYEFELGMSYLTNCDFNDLHSMYNFASSYAGNVGSLVTDETTIGTGNEEFFEAYTQLYYAKKAAYPDGMKQYEEIGNTAFIYLFNFLVSDVDYYSQEATIDAEDSIGLLIYAYKQIYRENSPIENVVLDLSLNTGGYENALAYVCGMFTGEYTFSIVNPMTNATSNSRYRIDANLDHEFDDEDWFYDKNLYCITSPISFSCANICAAILKENTNVTMLGRRTGGGSNIVQVFTTASGGWYQSSSNKKVVRNHIGAYYDIDKGIEVDYRFDKVEDFYDRKVIVELINSLH